MFYVTDIKECQIASTKLACGPPGANIARDRDFWPVVNMYMQLS